MRRLILIMLICLLGCLVLNGCGDKTKQTDLNSNTNSETSNNNVEIAENNPKDEILDNTTNTNENENTFVDDDDIIEFDDIPNQAPEEDIVVTKVDESAQGLVFAYYQKKDGQLTFGDVLTNYTTDYTTIKYGQKQRRVFLGFKLDENDRIQRAYACGIYKGTLFALEGTRDGGKFESNKAIINRLYPSNEIVDDGHRYYVHGNDTHVETRTDGYASTFYEGGASIDRYGMIYCD